MWVTDDVMIELITHTTNTIKWIFDENIIHTSGWIERYPISTLSQVSQGGVKMVMIIMLNTK